MQGYFYKNDTIGLCLVVSTNGVGSTRGSCWCRHLLFQVFDITSMRASRNSWTFVWTRQSQLSTNCGLSHTNLHTHTHTQVHAHTVWLLGKQWSFQTLFFLSPCCWYDFDRSLIWWDHIVYPGEKIIYLNMFLVRLYFSEIRF